MKRNRFSRDRKNVVFEWMMGDHPFTYLWEKLNCVEEISSRQRSKIKRRATKKGGKGSLG